MNLSWKLDSNAQEEIGAIPYQLGTMIKVCPMWALCGHSFYLQGNLYLNDTWHTKLGLFEPKQREC